MIKVNNNKGMILVVSFIVIVSLIMLGSVFLVIAVSEKDLAKKDYYNKQAFCLAEAGIERARNTSGSVWAATNPIGPFNDDAGIGQYEVTRISDGSDPKKFTFESWGYVPSKASPKAQKRIAEVIKLNSYNIGEFAISSQGSLDIKGNASIDGDILSGGSISVAGSASVSGETLADASFMATFENIFGKTEAELRALPPDNIFTDPPNNQEEVSGFTWVDFSEEGSAFKITAEGWVGSGILIVNGGDLDISGGTFDGIIWVVGALKISGNPQITGTIFAESGAEVDTTVIGRPAITYDKTTVETVLGEISAAFPDTTLDYGYEIISWKEF